MGANYGVYLPEEQVLEIVRGWRGKHPRTVNMWYGTEDAAIAAVAEPGEVQRKNRLAFQYDRAWLRMRLPSGRYLCYPQAEVNGGRHVCHVCEGKGTVQAWAIQGQPGPHPIEPCNACEGTGIMDLGPKKLSYMGVDQYTRQWKRLPTYGGKLIENATQASSRDVFYHGAMLAEAAGYEIVMRIHDELICEVPDTDDFTAEGLAAIMAEVPPWAEGLPLAAAGYETTRYRKG